MAGTNLTCLLLDLTIDSEDLEAFSETVVDTLERWSNLNPRQLWDTIVKAILNFGPSLLAALLVLVVGMLLAKGLSRIVGRLLKKSKVDKTLHYFIRMAVKIVLYALVVITSLGILGIPLTPLITALGAAGLAISLAVQDTLSNLAGGLSILVNRPFAAGDFIEVNDMSGTVRQIRLVYTLISTTDNKDIYLPNGDVSKASVINYSAEPTRRLDLTFSVRGDCDLDAAKGIISQEVQGCELVLQQPEPAVRVSGQTYLLVHIACLVWVRREDYFTVNDYLIRSVRKQLSEQGFFPAYGRQEPQ